MPTSAGLVGKGLICAHRFDSSVHTCHEPHLRTQIWLICAHNMFLGAHLCTHTGFRVLSATEWTASVHTPHVHTCNVARVQSATEWTASVHTLHMSTPVILEDHPIPKTEAILRTASKKKDRASEKKRARQVFSRFSRCMCHLLLFDRVLVEL